MAFIMVCSLSGSELLEGVIDKERGFIYQKSTILCHLRAYGTCPHTNTSMKQSDLIPIITGKSTALTNSGKSISEMVDHLNNEYDSLILDAYTNKQELQKLRQELAVSLYQQDASLRVIAKLQSQISKRKSQVVGLMQQIRIKNINANQVLQ